MALEPPIKLMGDGYFKGDMDPFTMATSVCPTVCFTGDAAIVTLDGDTASTADLAGDITDFKGEDKRGEADVMMDLNGRPEEYTLRLDLGEAGGVMVMDDLSKRDPAVVTGDVRVGNTEADTSPFKPAASVAVGALTKDPGETWTL